MYKSFFSTIAVSSSFHFSAYLDKAIWSSEIPLFLIHSIGTLNLIFIWLTVKSLMFFLVNCKYWYGIASGSGTSCGFIFSLSIFISAFDKSVDGTKYRDVIDI